MSNRIGVMLDSFRCDVITGIDKAAAIGAGAVQISVGDGPCNPDKLDAGRRKEIYQHLTDSGLVVSAVCGDFGGHGLSNAQENKEWRMAAHKRQIELAHEWKCSVLTTHIGVIPEDPQHPRYSVMLDAVTEIAEYGSQFGVRMAIETGPETPETLKGFVDKVACGFAGVNYDPANLVMVLGVDPVAGVHTLGKRILHTHAKDGKMLAFVGAEKVYNFFADGGIEDLRIGECFIETPLGQGSVDFPAYIEALNQIGYTGYLTIEREVGETPEADIRMAMDFLRALL